MGYRSHQSGARRQGDGPGGASHWSVGVELTGQFSEHFDVEALEVVQLEMDEMPTLLEDAAGERAAQAWAIDDADEAEREGLVGGRVRCLQPALGECGRVEVEVRVEMGEDGGMPGRVEECEGDEGGGRDRVVGVGEGEMVEDE